MNLADHHVRITLDTEPFREALGLDRDVSPDIAQAVFDVLEAGHKVGRIDGPTTPRAGELRFSLHVSDELLERLAALRAGDVEGVATEEIDHGSSGSEG